LVKLVNISSYNVETTKRSLLFHHFVWYLIFLWNFLKFHTFSYIKVKSVFKTFQFLRNGSIGHRSVPWTTSLWLMTHFPPKLLIFTFGRPLTAWNLPLLADSVHSSYIFVMPSCCLSILHVSLEFFEISYFLLHHIEKWFQNPLVFKEWCSRSQHCFLTTCLWQMTHFPANPFLFRYGDP